MIKKILFTLVILIAFPSFLFAKTQSRSKTVTKVDDLEVRVESNQPGEIDLKVENEKVEIKTSKNLTPTIFINRKITPTVSEISSFEKRTPKFFGNLFKDFLRFFANLRLKLDKIVKFL